MQAVRQINNIRLIINKRYLIRLRIQRNLMLTKVDVRVLGQSVLKRQRTAVANLSIHPMMTRELKHNRNTVPYMDNDFTNANITPDTPATVTNITIRTVIVSNDDTIPTDSVTSLGI